MSTPPSSTDRTLPYPDASGFLVPLAAESARFVEVLAAADPCARVPTCPDWTADDLLWHLTEVQAFWAAVCEGPVPGGGPVLDDAGLEAVEAGKPARPDDRDVLLRLAEDTTERLLAALRAATPSTAAWSWHAPDQTIGFTLRRQAHEALVHRVDAELTAGVDLTVPDAALAADGVDELLRVMWGLPDGDWATWTPSDRLVRVETTDTGHVWTLRLGRWSGTGPQSGREFDEATALVVDGVDAGAPVAVLRGRAADLDLHLWNRLPADPVERSGDPDALADLDEVIGTGIQ